MAIMKIMWSFWQNLSKTGLFLLASAIFLNSPVVPAQASSGSLLAPDTSFSVGFTFKLGGIDQICSGSVLAPTVVVTAAHCVQNTLDEKSTDYIFAAPGVALDAPINPNVKRPLVTKVVTVPGFVLTDANQKDDIAFLILDIPIAAKGFIRVATQSEISSLNPGTGLTGYGFGFVPEENLSYSNFTRKFPLEWSLPKPGINSVEVSSTTSSACLGDSGGSITTKLSTGEEVLVGVTSGAASVSNRCGTLIDGRYTMRITMVFPYLDLVKNELTIPASTPSPKAITKLFKIICVKGKTKKTYSGKNPKCPSGYKQISKVTISKS